MQRLRAGAPVVEWGLRLVVGLVIGVYAGSVGAGGGFLFAPILLWRYPEAPPEEPEAVLAP